MSHFYDKVYSLENEKLNFELYKEFLGDIAEIKELEKLINSDRRLATQEQTTQRKRLRKILGLLIKERINNGEVPQERLEHYKLLRYRLKQKSKERKGRYTSIPTGKIANINGKKSEELVISLLTCKGYSCIRMPDSWPDYDILVYFEEKWVRVQIKKFPGGLKGSAWRVIRTRRDNGQAYKCDVFVGVDLQRAELYWLPSSEISKNKSRYISKKFLLEK